MKKIFFPLDKHKHLFVGSDVFRACVRIIASGHRESERGRAVKSRFISTLQID